MATFKKAREAVCREKIAKLLWLMDFQDDSSGAMEAMLLRRLREIKERDKNGTNSSSKTIRKITFKFGGKKHVNLPPMAPVKGTSVSENPSCSKTTKINRYGDRSFGKRQFEMLKKNKNILPENPKFAINNGDHHMMEIKDFIKSIGGSEAEFVIEKTLTASDCNKNLGRLLIPAIQVKNPGFLTINEKRKLGMKECIGVDVYDPQRRKWTLNLAQWMMKNGNYALRTKWTDLVVANGLKENMVVRVLSFRINQELCFGVVRA